MVKGITSEETEVIEIKIITTKDNNKHVIEYLRTNSIYIEVKNGKTVSRTLQKSNNNGITGWKCSINEHSIERNTNHIEDNQKGI